MRNAAQTQPRNNEGGEKGEVADHQKNDNHRDRAHADGRF
jgi:hypothetical protein